MHNTIIFSELIYKILFSLSRIFFQSIPNKYIVYFDLFLFNITLCLFSIFFSRKVTERLTREKRLKEILYKQFNPWVNASWLVPYMWYPGTIAYIIIFTSSFISHKLKYFFDYFAELTTRLFDYFTRNLARLYVLLSCSFGISVEPFDHGPRQANLRIRQLHDACSILPVFRRHKAGDYVFSRGVRVEKSTKDGCVARAWRMPSHNRLSIRRSLFSWTTAARDFSGDKSTERFRRKSTVARRGVAHEKK